MEKDRFFTGLGGRALTEIVNASDGRNVSAQIRLFLAVLAMLFFVGNQASKVVFRKNYGVDIIQLVISFLVFLGIGIAEILFAFDDSPAEGLSVFANSFFIMGVVYVIFAFYILQKGLAERKAKQVTSNSEGDSGLLSFFGDYGLTENRIKYLAEPLYSISLSVLLLFYNPISAIPVAFCALSVWVYSFINHFRARTSVSSKLNDISIASQPQTETVNHIGGANTDF